MTIPLETFIALDENLAKRWQPRWRKHALPLATKIGEAVESENYDEAYRLIEQLDLSQALKGGEKDIRVFGMMALLFGATRISDENDTVFSRKRAPDILTESRDHLTLTIEALSNEIRLAMKRGVRTWMQQRQEERDQAYKAERIRSFVSFAKETAGKRGLSALQLASSLHMSRLSAWGYTAEAKAKGIPFYKISERLDSRTCPVCRVMDGKVFPVKNARTRLDTVLRTDDPAELKSINPWPSQSADSVTQLQNSSTQDLIDRGLDTPPYHPLCRGLLVPISPEDQVPNLQDTRPDTPDFIPQDQVTEAQAQRAASLLQQGSNPLDVVQDLALPLAIVEQIATAVSLGTGLQGLNIFGNE